MMFFEGNIAAPPTITVFSPDSSLFIILSCALTGATTAAVRASAPKAAADNNAMRFDMDWSPDGLNDPRDSAGDEWQQRRWFCRWTDCIAVAPSYGRFGGWVSGNKFSRG